MDKEQLKQEETEKKESTESKSTGKKSSKKSSRKSSQDKIKKELEEKNIELAELKDKYLRLFAEFDNYKKRTIKEKLTLLVRIVVGRLCY